ncbi:phosphotransferase [Solihabitans fulvus]|uniref:Phosphotransferase n=1 Tax=Solihabitans fulvus TaxID=1892852 RepID=A0A5B2WST2_9PSEU|nr:aminoglycoside 3'-phosphotransferase/choline kinase family protein [Solihabitans fulvus]KAA2253890.1 phosphotransferase [Solihabitans fulvus]
MAPRLILPDSSTDDLAEAACAEDSLLLPGVRAICARHSVDEVGDADIARFADGSLPVFALGQDLVLKLYPAVDFDDYSVEGGVLAAVHDRLPVPTPGVRGVGELDGWGYVLMDRLRGEPLDEVWPTLDEEATDRLADALGRALAALHDVDAPVVDTLDPRDWGAFLATQRESCVARQRKRGLDERWLAQIPEFLDRVALDPEPRGVLLHTEVMREHLLAARGPDGWALTGLFDFEPAMRGDAEYEFGAVGIFFSRGDRRVLRRVLTAYGYPPHELDHALSRRLLAHVLLHVYSHLPWYLRLIPVGDGVTTLDQLAEHWFGV